MKKTIFWLTSLLFLPLAMTASAQGDPVQRGAVGAQNAAQLEFEAGRYCEARFTSIQQDALKNCETQYITQKCKDGTQPARNTGMCKQYLSQSSNLNPAPAPATTPSIKATLVQKLGVKLSGN